MIMRVAATVTLIAVLLSFSTQAVAVDTSSSGSTTILNAYTKETPSDCKAGSYFDTGFGRCRTCRGCGSYQDEDGQSSCKTATVKSCSNVLPGAVPYYQLGGQSGARSLKEACNVVPKGSYYTDKSGDAPYLCYRIQKCTGCGFFQDQLGQKSCKVATPESCSSNNKGTVPKWSDHWGPAATSLDEACKLVPAGSYFENEAGTYQGKCYKVKQCYGCGSYQDEVGQSSCKTATAQDCGAGKVPAWQGWYAKEPATSLEEICKEVPAGSFYTEPSDNVTTKFECYRVQACQGCGTYQDEKGQKSCKQAKCQSGASIDVSGAKSESQVCLNGNAIPAGRFLDTTTSCVRSCFGCGRYSGPNATKCDIASCPSGTFPTIKFEATSEAQVCQTLTEGQGYSKNQCSLRSCTKLSTGLTCAKVQMLTYLGKVAKSYGNCASSMMTKPLLGQFDMLLHLPAICSDNLAQDIQGCNCPTSAPTSKPTTIAKRDPTTQVINSNPNDDLSTTADPGSDNSSSTRTSEMVFLSIVAAFLLMV